MNTLYATFSAPDGTALVGGYTADSGQTFGTLPAKAASPGVITGGHPWASASGTDCYALAQGTTLGLNDPIRVRFTHQGSAGTVNHYGIGQRLQPDGTGYFARWRSNGRAALEVIYPAGTSTFLATGDPSPALATGDYYWWFCPTNRLFEAYLQRVSDGYFMNPVTWSWQARKVPYLAVVDTISPAPIVTAGGCGFDTSFASTDTTPPLIVELSAGPGIMLPPDLGCSRTTDRVVSLTCLSAQGGQGEKTYTLQRSSGGAYVTIGAMTPGVRFDDRTVAPSTAYSYQVVATDSLGLSTTSTPVPVTTLAPLTLASYPRTMPTSPYTSFANGTSPNDATGTKGQWNAPRIFWDALYQCYFVVGSGNILGPGVELYAYYSWDLLNWIPSPYNPVVSTQLASGAGSLGSTTYTGMGGGQILAHPTEGHYYLRVKAKSSTAHYNFVFKSTSPMGPYYLYAGPNQPNGKSINDSQFFVDYDGTVWLICADADYNTQTAACQLTPDLSGFTGANLLLANDSNGMPYEGIAPYRLDRQIGMFASMSTGWNWNANTEVLFGQLPAGGSVNTPFTNAYTPNSQVFTTAAQAVAGPAGAGTPLPYGYGGSLGSGHTGYTGGTAYGIDPSNTYGGQVGGILRTEAGRWIFLTDRNSQTGDSTSTLCQFDLSWDSLGRPTIPFATTQTPVPNLVPAIHNHRRGR